MTTKPHMVIAGASGLIGRGLIDALKDRWTITVLTREVTGDEPKADDVLPWNPKAAKDGDEAHLTGLSWRLNGIDALVNLAGAPIAAGRFDDEHKARIRDSRIDATTTLVEAAQRCEVAPRVWFQSSGSSIFGDRGDEELDERSSLGDDFMAETARLWEAAAAPAGERSRLVIGRTAIVLHPEAEAWRRLVLPVRLFVGGPIAGGRMWWPWIHHEDLTRAIVWALETPDVTVDAANGAVTERVEGPYLLSAPEPARQIDLTRAAARVLRRPSFVPVPAFALRILFGGMPDNLLFPSTKVHPRKLQRHGFTFHHPTAIDAARNLLRGRG